MNRLLLNFITKVRNAYNAKVKILALQKDKYVLFICRKWYEYGLIRRLRVENDLLYIYFKFWYGSPFFEIHAVSKMSNRVYWKMSDFSTGSKRFSNHHIYFLCTSKGMLSSNQCVFELRASGEVIFKIVI